MASMCVLFKTGLDFRISEEEKLCLRLRRLSLAAHGWQATWRRHVYPVVSWSKSRNASDRGSYMYMQQHYTDCIAV